MVGDMGQGYQISMTGFQAKNAAAALDGRGASMRVAAIHCSGPRRLWAARPGAPQHIGL
jgi:hypothetical protein